MILKAISPWTNQRRLIYLAGSATAKGFGQAKEPINDQPGVLCRCVLLDLSGTDPQSSVTPSVFLPKISRRRFSFGRIRLGFQGTKKKRQILTLHQWTLVTRLCKTILIESTAIYQHPWGSLGLVSMHWF